MPAGNSAFEAAGLAKAGSVQQTGVADGQARMNAVLAQASAMGAFWQGQAAVSYMNGLESLRSNGNRLFQALSTMADLTNQTNNNFTTTHDETTNNANAMAQAQAAAVPTGLPGL